MSTWKIRYLFFTCYTLQLNSVVCCISLSRLREIPLLWKDGDRERRICCDENGVPGPPWQPHWPKYALHHYGELERNMACPEDGHERHSQARDIYHHMDQPSRLCNHSHPFDVHNRNWTPQQAKHYVHHTGNTCVSGILTYTNYVQGITGPHFTHPGVCWYQSPPIGMPVSSS